MCSVVTLGIWHHREHREHGGYPLCVLCALLGNSQVYCTTATTESTEDVPLCVLGGNSRYMAPPRAQRARRMSPSVCSVVNLLQNRLKGLVSLSTNHNDPRRCPTQPVAEGTTQAGIVEITGKHAIRLALVECAQGSVEPSGHCLWISDWAERFDLCR